MKILQRLLGDKLNLASEEFGGVGLERELTFYVKMSDLNDLKSLDSIEQLQWRLDLKDSKRPDAKFRARQEDGKLHSICCKIPHKTGEGDVEAETEVNAEFWNFMVKLFGNHGYKKTRYIYPIPETDLKFEIDVFLSESGQQHPFVKVDLEYPSTLPALPPFPFEIDQDTAIDGSNPDKEEQDFIDNLWENEWSRLDSAKGDLDPYYNQ